MADKVNKYTRSGRDGRAIFCPECDHPTVVYHFSWSGIPCWNCDDPFKPERFFNKEEWYIENQELTPPLTQEEAKDFYTRERGGKQCL